MEHTTSSPRRARAERLLRSRPADMDLLRHLAFTFAGCGRYAEAHAHAAKACELRPDDPRTWSDHGCIHALLGDLRGAVSRYRAAIDVDPDFAVGWHNLGVAQACLGLSRQACHAFRTALALDERCAETWLALGALLTEVGLLERALATFDRAERLGARAGLSITIPTTPQNSGDRPCVLSPPES